MTNAPTPIAAYGFSTFNDALYQLLKRLEGDIPFVYSDSKGIPTLGIGYALVVDTRGTPKWDLRKDYPIQLAAAGINLTPTQLADLKTKLNDAKAALNGDTSVTTPFSPYYPATARNNPLGWTIDTNQSKSLFDFAVLEYETRVKNWLGNVALYTSLQGSMEMAALFSMSFNGLINTSSSPFLKAAVLSGDRAEAWYQIRYVHADQLWYRRYAEAAMFGLYNDSAHVTDSDAKVVYQMFTQHHDAILGFGRDRPSDLATANQDLQSAGFTSVGALSNQDAFQLATDILVRDYGQDQAFDYLHIFVGGPSASAMFNSSTINRASDTQGDLIIGGTGNDTLIGSATGNDVLVAGTGNDTLQGGGGDDILVSGAGIDVLMGGAGVNKYLIGFAVAYSGSQTGAAPLAQSCIIKDGSGSGSVWLDGAALTGGGAIFEGNNKWADGGTVYQFTPSRNASSETGTMLITSGPSTGSGQADTITIDNFESFKKCKEAANDSDWMMAA